jgi:hypothetical protein
MSMRKSSWDSKYIPTYNEDDKLKLNRFISGPYLSYKIHLNILASNTLVEAFKNAKHYEEVG